MKIKYLVTLFKSKFYVFITVVKFQLSEICKSYPERALQVYGSESI